MIIEGDEIITWNDFKDKLPDHRTFGFLSRMSPDGEHVLSTVNESVYVVNFTDYRYLQVFYPTRGILAFYTRATRTFAALPGADDPDFVHCDPVWTPDGKTIVFARTTAQDPRVDRKASFANDPEELQVQYDLYRMPFDGGQGGEPIRIEGASANGMSNTFPKISPDGKWVVFVKCRNGQLMRPDSELWIVPLEGGEARRMTCNMPLENSWHPGTPMNSWHTFSPNGRWMAFSSKSNTPYTQLFLTHIDEEGNDSPAILVPNATASNRAVNIPEFVNIDYDDLHSISVPSVEYHRLILEGGKLYLEKKFDEAVAVYLRALDIEPDSVMINYNLGSCMASQEKFDEAMAYYERCLEIVPRHTDALFLMAEILRKQGKPVEAATLYRKVAIYAPHQARGPMNLAPMLAKRGRHGEAATWWRKALAIEPGNPLAMMGLGDALAGQDKFDEAIDQYQNALAISPRLLPLLNATGIALAKQGRTDEAVEMFERALRINPNDEMSRYNLDFVLKSRTTEQ
jgi:tetratricopeptide (TPR) repeat protein